MIRIAEDFMQIHSDLKARFKENRVCVLIPTYNNAGSLKQVISDVSAYCDDILVVNDGSTDHTETIIDEFSTLHKINYHPNKGKGWALRQGFAMAKSKGFEYAITIDSDGQHFASDLPQFLDKLDEEKNAIIIGARNMNQESVPGGSSFGNRFSNFWFKLETGINVPDTQSGYRLYPLEKLAEISYFTTKYEFEIEVMVRAAWQGINVCAVPVNVYYAPAGERVSHFRPYKDFLRISVLNTFLVLISFLYIKPRDIIRDIRSGVFWNKLGKLMMVPGESDLRKAVSLGFGVFMGIFPIWGFQLITAIFVSFLLKMNKALVILGANISIPPMIPFVVFGSYKIGAYWMGSRAMEFDFTKKITMEAVKNNLEQYLYGSITLAFLAGIFFGLLSYFIFKMIPRKAAIAN